MKNQVTTELWSREATGNKPLGEQVLLEQPFRHLEVERLGDVHCVRLRERRLDESALTEMGEELVRLIRNQGCRKLVLSLGPDTPDLLYSVFLAKLVLVRRLLLEHGGGLKLTDLTPQSREVFEACQLADFFEFAPDQPTAVAAFAAGVE